MSYSETITRADLINILNRIMPAVQHTAIVGEIIQYAGDTAPIGWLMCDGSAVSRTTYAELFNVIGTTYGSGDGSTTFNLPDLRDNFTVGAGTTYELGDTGGEATVTLTTNEIPSHTHKVNYVNYNRGTGSNATMGYLSSNTQTNYANTEGTGGGQAHENRPPYIALNYIIYAGVDDEGLIADDYVVEQGTSGDWTYRKWNSGIAECWCKITGTWSVNFTSQVSGVYSATGWNANQRSLPSGLFTSVTSASGSVQTSGYTSFQVSSFTTSSITFRAWNSYAVNGMSIYSYTLNVKGTWK